MPGLNIVPGVSSRVLPGVGAYSVNAMYGESSGDGKRPRIEIPTTPIVLPGINNLPGVAMPNPYATGCWMIRLRILTIKKCPANQRRQDHTGGN